MLIDCALATISLILGARLLTHGRREGEVSALVLAGGFVASAIAWGAAAIVQVDVERLGGSGLEVAFRLAALMIALSSFCLAASVILACFGNGWRRLLLAVVAIKLAIFAFWMLTSTDERLVLWDLTSSLLIIAVLEGWAGFAGRARSAPWMLGGVVVGLAGILLRVGVGQWGASAAVMLYNLCAAAGLYFLYRGGLRLHDRLP